MNVLIVRYGLIVGVLIGSLVILEGIVGIDIEAALSGLHWGLLRYPLLVGGIIFGVIRMRSVTEPEERTYWRSVGQGTLISLVASLILAICNLVFHEVLVPDYFEKSKDAIIKYYEAEGMNSSEIEYKLVEMEQYESTSIQVSIYFVEVIVIGFLVSLVTSLFFRKEKREAFGT